MTGTWPLDVGTWWVLPNSIPSFSYCFTHDDYEAILLQTCRDCGSKLSKCPICREQITNHIKLFTGWLCLDAHILFSVGSKYIMYIKSWNSFFLLLHTFPFAPLLWFYMCTLWLLIPHSSITYLLYTLEANKYVQLFSYTICWVELQSTWYHWKIVNKSDPIPLLLMQCYMVWNGRRDLLLFSFLSII